MLSLAVKERPNPIAESPTQRFLISQLSGNLPKRNSFSTSTIDRLCSRTFTIGRGIDDRVMRNRFSTIFANNLVFHLHAFKNSSFVFAFRHHGDGKASQQQRWANPILGNERSLISIVRDGTSLCPR